MIRRSTRIALEALVGLVLAVVLLTAGALWRLSQGPVPVDFLTPHLEAAFSASDSPFTAQIGSAELTWGGWRRTLDLRARDLRLRGPAGQTVAQLPELYITLSLRALAQGVVAPTAVELTGASLTLERDRDGRFGVVAPVPTAGTAAPETVATGETEAGAPPAPAQPGETQAEVAALLPAVIDRLLAPPDPADPLSFLRSVRGRGLTVTLADRRLGTSLQAREATIELFRQADGIAGNASLSLDLGSRPARLEATLDYTRTDRRLQVATAFRDLHLPELGRLAPELAGLRRAALPLDGLVEVALDETGRVDSVGFDLVSGAGVLDLPELYASPLEIGSVAASGRYDAAEGRVAVEDFALQLGGPAEAGPSLRARINLDFGEGYRDLGIGARLDRVETADLARYWPTGMAENGRAWVLENIAGGAAENLELVASARVPTDAPEEAALDRFGGSFDFSGLEVHYLRPMPPARDVAGKARFDADGLTFDVAGGELEGLAVGPGEVRVFGLSGRDHRLDLAFDVAGGLQPTLALLDHPRLRLIERLGVPVAGSGGEVTARVGFAFPLIAELTENEIEISAEAQLAGVRLADAAFGLDVTHGDLALALDSRAMRLSGPLSLEGLPVEVDWTEYFAAHDGLRRELTASTTALDAATRARLDLPLADYLQGPMAAALRLTGAADETARVEVDLQLAETEMEIPQLDWRKPAGAAGTASLVAELWGQRLVALRDLELYAGDLAVTGAATFSPEDGSLIQANLGQVSLGATSLNDIAVKPWASPAGPGWDVQIAGGRLDAARWLDAGEGKPEAETPDGPDAPDAAAAAQRSDPADAAPQTPLRLQVVRLQSLLLGEARALEAVALEGVRGPRGWERLVASAEVPRRWWRHRGAEKPEDAEIAQKLLRLDWGPAETGQGYALQLGADDLGAVLRAFGWVEDMEGGETRITGTSPAPLLAAPIEAQLEVRDYTLVEAPLIGRIIAGASLGGLGGMLAEDNGITFERGTGALVLENGVLSTDLVRAYGPALGITARGALDIEADAIDLQGTLVPAYAINQVLGAIPILGPLLTGGEGEGVLGVTYGVSGTLDSPEVSVNPLSALAPGFLRGLFSGKIEGAEAALEALPAPGGDR